MLTAAVRELHAAFPGQYQTDVRTSAPALWENNPFLTRLREGGAGVRVMDMHYPLIHQCNQRPYHFLHGYTQYLEGRLGIRLPVTRFRGDIHLSPGERTSPPPCPEAGLAEGFWILVAGGKYDFTAKWWNPASAQKVIDHFRGRIQFVQCGEAGHWHPRLRGVVDLVGKTNLREFVRLMYHAAGVVCPVTFAMHLAAAVDVKPGCPKSRACVVVAGGREPPHWEAYPQHQYISTNGTLPCCADGGCWKSRCQLVGDGDRKDRHDLCEYPVQVNAELRIPKCMHLITPEDVIRRVQLFYEGGALSHEPVPTIPAMAGDSPATASPLRITTPGHARRVLLEFRHGLGDAVQLTVVLKHLRHYYPDWQVDVAALTGRHSAFQGLCRRVFVLDRDPPDRAAYDQSYVLEWHECHTNQVGWPSTKATRCLQEVFRLNPIPELCTYTVNYGGHARELVRRYLGSICPTAPADGERFPAVLMHYQGNTSVERKNLPHDLIRAVCEATLRVGFVPVILDWDRRSPLVDGSRIHNPDARHELWAGTGTGDAETLAALIDASALLIGIDSGPLHVAGATTTPAIGVWTRHHPVHFFDLAHHVTHLVPRDHENQAARPESLAYFANNYLFHTYNHLYAELPALVESTLTGVSGGQLNGTVSPGKSILSASDASATVPTPPPNTCSMGQLTATGYGECYYQEHKMAGLDYLYFGEWQQQYGRWFVESLGLRGKKVLDVGCACGAILRGLGQAGAVAQGVEVNEHMVQLGREKWPDMARLLYVCDAVNLHLFADASWDAVHSSQVAEHWQPALVPHILRELWRVTTEGGLLFCCLDTEELFARQGRRMEREDPTHVCIRPMQWWHEQLAEAGWWVCSGEYEGRLVSHPEGFLKRYDWDWFIARKIQ